MSFASISKTLTTEARSFVKVFEDSVNTVLNPNLTDAEKAKRLDELLSNRSEAASDAYQAEARTTAKEAVTKHLLSEGWSKDAAENWFEVHWRKLFAPDNIRNTKQDMQQKVESVEKAGKFLW